MGELVIVCCHAICTDPLNPHQESNWLLKPFQQSDTATGKTGEHETFMLHIQAGISALRRPHATLVFSGAKTEPDAQLSEAESYRDVLVRCSGEASDILEAISDGRILCEDAATDSYQNLLFSLIKYYEYEGDWPAMITVITHSFKETRFLECHAQAIRWPSDKIRVHGINPPFPLSELREVQSLESNTVDQFRKDPFGAHPPLSSKRQARQWNPNSEVIPGTLDRSVREQLRDLVTCNGRRAFSGSLPWDSINP